MLRLAVKHSNRCATAYDIVQAFVYFGFFQILTAQMAALRRLKCKPGVTEKPESGVKDQPPRALSSKKMNKISQFNAKLEQNMKV